MESIPNQQQCDTCEITVANYDGVNLSDGDTSRFLCSKCYNESIAASIGVNFEHLSFHPIVLKDANDENHTFHFQTHLFGNMLQIRALEIQKSEHKGYEFSECANAEDDLFSIFTKLVERMRQALERKHIEPSELTRYRITDEGTVRGHVTWDDDNDGEAPCLVIDGKELSWHEFGRMLMSYEGFHFKLNIFEDGEEK